MKPILLYRPGELTPHGDPIIVHFGPGCTIGPYEKSTSPNSDKATVTVHGQKFTVRGDWREIARRAGYDDLVNEFERANKEQGKKHVERPADRPESPRAGMPAQL